MHTQRNQVSDIIDISALHQPFMPQANAEPEPTHRDRILSAAESLIATSGSEAATTRAVAAAAGVQPPMLYRLFGDKDGLLDAVAERALQTYIASKRLREVSGDPLDEVRNGWDLHVEFGLARPAIFLVMTLRSAEGRETAAMRQGIELLRGKIRRLAGTGRLRVAEVRAVELLQSAANGVILTLLAQPPEARDLALSHAMREALIATLVGGAREEVDGRERGAALALRAHLLQLRGLSDGERHLLGELLDRIVG